MISQSIKIYMELSTCVKLIEKTDDIVADDDDDDDEDDNNDDDDDDDDDDHVDVDDDVANLTWLTCTIEL